MNHLADGVLRRVLDEPLALGAAERAHYDSCTECRARADAIARDAAAVANLMAVPDLALDASLALGRVRAGLRPRPRVRMPIGGRALGRLGSIAAVVLIIFALTTSGLADSFLQIFEPKRFVAIPVTESDLRALPYPIEYGTIAWSGPGKDDWSGGRSVQTLDLAAARAASGLPVLVPQRLPANAASPSYRVVRAARMTFTFSAAKARDAAARRGKTLPPMPANIDGSSLYVDVGPVVFATYAVDRQTGAPALLVIEASPPVVSSDGVTVTQLRDYLLAQPGISKTLAEQIRAVSEPESTLPIPFPIDRALSRTVSVGGRDALLIGDSTGAGSLVFWRDGDVVRAVGGPLTEREVLVIANSLR